MIPILFDKSTSPKTIVNSNNLGLGMLNDCITATVTEELNGQYELVIEYPISGAHFSEIDVCSWIKAKPYVDGPVQLFRVYKISKPIDGVCTINAEHLSYILDYALINTESGAATPSDRNLSMAMYFLDQKIMEDEYKTGGDLHFSLAYEDQRTPKQFWLNDVRSFREYLLGKDYSLLSIYDGEYLFDNFNITLCNPTPPGSRGADKGVKIMYGKNLCSLRQETSDEALYTAIYPYIKMEFPWTSETGSGHFLKRDISDYVETNPIIHIGETYPYYYPKTLALNLKEFGKWKNIEWEGEEPFVTLPITADDFLEAAFQYALEHEDDLKIYHSIEVSFINVADSEEYKNIEALETINMGDFVTVEYPNFDVSEKLEVIKTEFNVLEERYNNITLGRPRKTLV